MRVRLKAEIEEAEERLARAQAITGPIPSLIVQGVNRQANLQSYVGKSVGQIAQEEDKHVIDAMLDLSIAGDLNVEFLGPDRGSYPTHTGELINQSPYTFPGISDGGAHTQILQWRLLHYRLPPWLVRDEQKVSLEEAHFRLSALPAHAAGFRDRGMLREGAPADVVVYELESLAVEPRWVGEVVEDLPGGEWRRVHGPTGTRRSWSTARSPSKTASAPGPRPASSSATVGVNPGPAGISRHNRWARLRLGPVLFLRVVASHPGTNGSSEVTRRS